MWFTKVVCFAVLLIISVSAVPRIVGGESTTIEKYPFQATLNVRYPLLYPFLFCGAVIYKLDWIITAGHCCEDETTDSFEVCAGSTYSYKDGICKKVSKIIINPDFGYTKGGAPYNDICLVKLESPFEESDKIQPIGHLSNGAEEVEGNNLTITGYGSPMYPVPVTTLNLKVTEVPYVSQEECREAYGEEEITDSMGCAGRKGKDTCQGDSGGPYFVLDVLVGLTSWGNGCGEEGYPGVYTRIVKFIGWIVSTCA